MPRHLHALLSTFARALFQSKHCQDQSGYLDVQVTPRHTLVWGTEVDLGSAWGDPACSMPATASHSKAPVPPNSL